MLEVKTVDNKEEWDKFILSQPYQPFFQSWSWGEIQERLGNKILRLGVYDPSTHSVNSGQASSGLVGICQVAKIKAKRGCYFHLRHGPLLSNFTKQFPRLLAQVIKQAKEEKMDFIRMSPLVEEKKFRGFRSSPIHNMDAENAWVLELNKSEEELLQEMRKTTRYLIKKGERSGLEVVKTSSQDDLKAFLRLYQKTAAKHGFVPHQGIKEELEVFGKDNQAVLFLCRFKKRIISGAIVIFYGNQAVYHHGATDPKFEYLSPSYLLQWEAIKEAKRQGKKFYNFWGVVPPDKPHHPWQGLTLFKTGFGGHRVNFIHTQDLPLSLWYWKTFLIETIIRIRKGY